VKAASKLWLAWEEHAADHPFTAAAQQARDATDGLEGIKSRRGHTRKNEARSIPQDEFAALYGVVADGEDIEDVCLQVMMTTGLRIHDLLGVTVDAVRRGARTGTIELDAKGGKFRRLPWAGAKESWDRLLDELPPDDTRYQNLTTVADILTGQSDTSTRAGSAAYKRVTRQLTKHVTALGLQDRFHLHRLRRTVAIEALRATGDIMAVKELLGHESITTTSGYLDEARSEEVGALQRKITPKR
jgi:site-specific recombinase XerC